MTSPPKATPTTKGGKNIIFIDGERYIHAPVRGLNKAKRNIYMQRYRKRRLAERKAMAARLQSVETTTPQPPPPPAETLSGEGAQPVT